MVNTVFWLVRYYVNLYVVLTEDITKDHLIGLIDKSYFVFPAKKPLWHKAISEYYNER